MSERLRKIEAEYARREELAQEAHERDLARLRQVRAEARELEALVGSLGEALDLERLERAILAYRQLRAEVQRMDLLERLAADRTRSLL